MSLSDNLALKLNDNTTTETFNKAIRPKVAGVYRRNTALDDNYPETGGLTIRSQETGSGATKGFKVNLVIDHVIPDANGVLQRGYVSLTLQQPLSVVFTIAMMADLLHQIHDVTCSTSSFTEDTTVIQSLMGGEA